MTQLSGQLCLNLGLLATPLSENPALITKKEYMDNSGNSAPPQTRSSKKEETMRPRIFLHSRQAFAALGDQDQDLAKI